MAARSTMRPASTTKITSAASIGREPVRDHQAGSPAHHHLEAPFGWRLRSRVQRAGRFVQDQDARILEQDARDREALTLAARELVAALADHRLVAGRQRGDEVVRCSRRAPRLRAPRRSPPACRSADCPRSCRGTDTSPASRCRCRGAASRASRCARRARRPARAAAADRRNAARVAVIVVLPAPDGPTNATISPGRT